MMHGQTKIKLDYPTVFREILKYQNSWKSAQWESSYL